MSERIALVAGATGHVGRHCVELLLQDESYSRVIGLVRRPILLAHPKFTQLQVDFDHLESISNQIRADDIFVCLGTTSTDTPGRDLYHKIDVQYPAEIAAIAKRNGATSIGLVSSIGAHPNSRAWYLRFKNEIEEKVIQIGFESTAIFRPSIIDGRQNNPRLKEKLALATVKFWSFLFFGRSRRFLPLTGELIARAMIAAAKAHKPGVTVLDRLDMLDLLQIPH